MIISYSDLDHFREMLRVKRRQKEFEQPRVNPTHDDLFNYIFRDMTKLTHLSLSDCHLTNISKQGLSQIESIIALFGFK